MLTEYHLATHYLPDTQSVMASRLVLAKGATPSANKTADGELQNSEIYQLKLPHTRLVILSACQTSLDQNLAGEGAIGAARPFLAIGVPQVIASLWPVDSNATAVLMTEFHRQRRMLSQASVAAEVRVLKNRRSSTIRGRRRKVRSL